MTTLPIISVDDTITVTPEPLTPAAFAPFGTAITAPFAASLTSIPASTGSSSPSSSPAPQAPEPLHPSHQPRAVFANQNTALKTSPISPLTNNYPPASAGAGRNNNGGATGLMSVFSCFPRRDVFSLQDQPFPPKSDSNLRSGGNRRGRRQHQLRIKISILERHPYTTQTFCPFSISSSAASTSKREPKPEVNTGLWRPRPRPKTTSSSTSSDNNGNLGGVGSGGGNSIRGRRAISNKTYALIVVAPTIVAEIPTPQSQPTNPPDLSRVRAFFAPISSPATLGPGSGSDSDSDPDSEFRTTSYAESDAEPGWAVTYAPGTWHAPMIVLGSRRVDFLVTQFVSGTPEDDCQEVVIGGVTSSSPSSSPTMPPGRNERGEQEPAGIVEVDLSSLDLLLPAGPHMQSRKEARLTSKAKL